MKLLPPPKLPGLPILGNALEFNKNRGRLLRKGYETLGSIFTIQLGPQPVAVLVGPEYHDFFFNETDKKLAMDKPYQFLAVMFGEPVAFTAGPETYEKHRPVLFAPFQGRKMAGYIQVMIKETQTWIDTLAESGRFDVVTSFEKLAQHIAAHALMGENFRRRMGAEFWNLYRDLSAGLDPLLPPNLPLPKFLRRDRARRRMSEMLQEVINARRAEPGGHSDFLQDFIEAHFEDDSPVNDSLIISMILALIFAGHETTAGQAAWTMIQLLQNPDYLNRVVAEQEQVFAEDKKIDGSKIRQLKHLEWALRETERTHPSADIMLRYNTEGYEIGGYYVPQGWLTMVTPHIAHLMPELFAQPDAYDPLRYEPQREEHKQHAYSLIGFGGGKHKCAGMSFANNEMMVIVNLLLQNLEMELETVNPQPTYALGASRPTPPVWIRYRRKGKIERKNPGMLESML